MLTEIENIFVMISGSSAKTFKQPDHQIQLLYIVCYLPLLESVVKLENKLISFDFVILLEDIAQ